MALSFLSPFAMAQDSLKHEPFPDKEVPPINSEAVPDNRDILTLNIEDLLNIEVTSVGKKEQE